MSQTQKLLLEFEYTKKVETDFCSHSLLFYFLGVPLYRQSFKVSLALRQSEVHPVRASAFLTRQSRLIKETD